MILKSTWTRVLEDIRANGGFNCADYEDEIDCDCDACPFSLDVDADCFMLVEAWKWLKQFSPKAAEQFKKDAIAVVEKHISSLPADPGAEMAIMAIADELAKVRQKITNMEYTISGILNKGG